jgi:chromate transporter
VIAIVAVAVVRIGKRVLKNEVMWMIAAAAFVAIFYFKVPFPAIVLSAVVIGLVGGRLVPHKFRVIGAHGKPEAEEIQSSVLEHTKPSWGRAIKVITVCVTLWWVPLLLIGYWVGWDHTLFREGLFFSKAAMVTFGGAYAVLPYVAQQSDKFHWLEPGQMMDGLGLAETTPGPLIMVVQFVGFLAGWNQPGELPTLTAATLGALIATWATFVPCFLWIFLGAPHIEQMRGNAMLTTSLSAVTAAVVGVVLNLAVWFAAHALFPDGGSIDWFLLSLSAAAGLVMVRWKLDIVPVVLLSAMLGLMYKRFTSM